MYVNIYITVNACTLYKYTKMCCESVGLSITLRRWRGWRACWLTTTSLQWTPKEMWRKVTSTTSTLEMALHSALELVTSKDISKGKKHECVVFVYVRKFVNVKMYSIHNGCPHSQSKLQRNMLYVCTIHVLYIVTHSVHGGSKSRCRRAGACMHNVF